MNEDVAKRLHDAWAACNEMQRIGQRYSRTEFLDDFILELAVWKLVEIVGEALHQAERLEPTVASDIPDLRRIVDTRNRLTHGYDSVNFNLLWDIVIFRNDSLLESLEKMLSSE